MSILDQQSGFFFHPLMYPTSGNNLAGENGDTIDDIVNDPDSTEERDVGDVKIVNGRARVGSGSFKPVELPTNRLPLNTKKLSLIEKLKRPIVGGESDGGSGRMLRGAIRNALNATRKKL